MCSGKVIDWVAVVVQGAERHDNREVKRRHFWGCGWCFARLAEHLGDRSLMHRTSDLPLAGLLGTRVSTVQRLSTGITLTRALRSNYCTQACDDNELFGAKNRVCRSNARQNHVFLPSLGISAPCSASSRVYDNGGGAVGAGLAPAAPTPRTIPASHSAHAS